MTAEEFCRLYREIVESHDLDPETAAIILQRILEILAREKEEERKRS